MDEGYPVGELARRLGVSVRTLHHYDAIGLVVPSHRTDAGYRAYSAADVERLSHVVAYRACGLSLGDIATLLDGDIADRAEHLRHQLDLLDERLGALGEQREVLRRAWEAQQMGIDLDPSEIVEVFGSEDPTQYAEEVRDRWGDTDAYRQSRERTSRYRAEDWAAAQAEGEEVLAEFVACLVAGEPADGPRADAAARAHREQINRWYYACDVEMQVGLAEMYLADPRFTAYYDDRMPGLAQYVHDAIVASALREG